MGRLVLFVMKHGASQHTATEAAQIAFTLAFERWTSIEHPAAWLRTVAFRQMVKLHPRWEQPYDEVPDQPGGRCPAAAFALLEEEARVFEALSWLPPRQRQALAWSLDGFSAVEIARALDVTPEAVRQNLARARRSLKQALGIQRGGTP